ncbi:MAG: cell division protein ZapE [Demequina sp.]
MTETLVGRRPDVPASTLITQLTPPPHFSHASFDSYVPDADYPSQARARDQVREFGRGANGGRFWGRRASAGKGLYLDGGFGVGKTHLLAALAHQVGDDAAFGTFVEYTSLVGALGFVATRDALAQFHLVCIDEFELDDPGDTVLMSRLMRELADAGVALAATSNTPPGALGTGRFAAEDFQREIQALSDAFTVVAIDGPDYRHREGVQFPPPATADQVAAECDGPRAVCERWRDVVDDLRHVHPSKLGAYVDGISLLGLQDVAPLNDQAQALRWVALVDRLYDRDVRLIASGDPLDQIFTPTMLAGGYRKKYLRALSRMRSMTAGE